ncbi:MAG: catecholate siderophore receptor [Acidobacteriaceae bacterium]|jgi:catecholate siderophore receptor|nr:catecholate siderophore receptor [Acidobacteriaceae bacterium]
MNKSFPQNPQPAKRSELTRARKAWLTLGTVAAYAAVSITKSVPAWAQDVTRNSANGKTKEQQNLTVRRLDIPPGPLDATIKAYKGITGIEVSFSIPAETVPGFKSPGVKGLYTEDQALRALLAGTGLSYQIGSDGAVTIAVRVGESVEVNDSSPQLSLDRYPVPLLDTPQSITTISQAIIHEEGATTLRDTLRNAPGISLAAGEGGSQGDNLTLRGFTARNDIFLDGMRDFGSYYRDSFDYREVEVLEGPSSVTFGRGSTGGVINQESKTPVDRRSVVVEGDFGTDITRRFTADINQPLQSLGHGAALRLNLMGNASNVAERDVTENRRFGVAPSFALGLGTANRLTTSYFHFQEDDIPDYGIPWYFNKPSPVARHNYYGFRDNYLRTDVDMGTIKAEHDISDWAILRNRFRVANNHRDARITEPQLNNATAGTITPSTPLDQISVNRNQIATLSDEGLLWDQLDATAHLNTFGIRHVVVIGAEGGRETSDPVRPTFNFVNPAGQTINTVPTANLLRPNEDQSFSGSSAPASNVHVTSTSYGLYLLDTLQFGSHWELIGGARFDRFLTDEKSIVYPTPKQAVAGGPIVQGPPTITYPSRLDRKPSWRAAAVYKPVSYGSIYFDYGTSFNPSAEALALTVGPAGTGTANLAPEFNRSYEVGTKWDLSNARFSVRADLYRTTKDNAREASPTNSLLYVLAGTQRVDGAELVLNGRVTNRWQVLSSYTFMHSEVVNSQYYPLSVGYRLANVPNNLFNLWTTYQPLQRLTIGGGGNYVDSRTASSTVPLDPTTGLVKQVPGYVVLNAMARYTLTDNLSLQANIFNLANRNYIDEIHPAHIVPGAGTSGLFGLNFRF